MSLIVVRAEGGLIERVGILEWLTSDAPIWGFRFPRWYVVHDSILIRYGLSPWRAHRIWRHT